MVDQLFYFFIMLVMLTVVPVVLLSLLSAAGLLGFLALLVDQRDCNIVDHHVFALIATGTVECDWLSNGDLWPGE